MKFLPFLGIVLIIALASILLPAFIGGAWSPSRRKIVEKMIGYANLRRGDVLFDLGAGDGRVLMAATRLSDVKAVGVEVDPLRFFICQVRIQLNRLTDRAKVIKKNFFQMDLSEANVITFYLSQAAADKLASKLAAELQPGSRVISYRRPIPGWTPTIHDKEDDIYVYEVAATQTSEKVVH